MILAIVVLALNFYLIDKQLVVGLLIIDLDALIPV